MATDTEKRERFQHIRARISTIRQGMDDSRKIDSVDYDRMAAWFSLWLVSAIFAVNLYLNKLKVNNKTSNMHKYCTAPNLSSQLHSVGHFLLQPNNWFLVIVILLTVFMVIRMLKYIEKNYYRRLYQFKWQFLVTVLLILAFIVRKSC